MSYYRQVLEAIEHRHVRNSGPSVVTATSIIERGTYREVAALCAEVYCDPHGDWARATEQAVEQVAEHAEQIVALLRGLLARARERGIALTMDADAMIDLTRLPELRAWLWDIHVSALPASEVFELYQQRWLYLDSGRMDTAERAVVCALIERVGGGRFEVRTHRQLQRTLCAPHERGS